MGVAEAFEVAPEEESEAEVVWRRRDDRTNAAPAADGGPYASQFPGVQRLPTGLWRAQIWHPGGNVVPVGDWPDERTASLHADAAQLAVHPEFAAQRGVLARSVEGVDSDGGAASEFQALVDEYRADKRLGEHYTAPAPFIGPLEVYVRLGCFPMETEEDADTVDTVELAMTAERDALLPLQAAGDLEQSAEMLAQALLFAGVFELERIRPAQDPAWPAATVRRLLRPPPSAIPTSLSSDPLFDSSDEEEGEGGAEGGEDAPEAVGSAPRGDEEGEEARRWEEQGEEGIWTDFMGEGEEGEEVKDLETAWKVLAWFLERAWEKVDEAEVRTCLGPCATAWSILGKEGLELDWETLSAAAHVARVRTWLPACRSVAGTSLGSKGVPEATLRVLFRTILTQAGKSAHAVASLLGIAPSDLARWERGEPLAVDMEAAISARVDDAISHFRIGIPITKRWPPLFPSTPAPASARPSAPLPAPTLAAAAAAADHPTVPERRRKRARGRRIEEDEEEDEEEEEEDGEDGGGGLAQGRAKGRGQGKRQGDEARKGRTKKEAATKPTTEKAKVATVAKSKAQAAPQMMAISLSVDGVTLKSATYAGEVQDNDAADAADEDRCCVCGSDTPALKTQSCDKCGVVVHAHCYRGAPARHDGAWTCDMCGPEQAGPPPFPAPRCHVTRFEPRPPRCPEDIARAPGTCVLCERLPMGLACKPVVEPPERGPRFMHLVCALYAGTVRYMDRAHFWHGSVSLCSLGRIDREKCGLCHRSFGVLVGCESTVCRERFHPSCALRSGVLRAVSHDVYLPPAGGEQWPPDVVDPATGEFPEAARLLAKRFDTLPLPAPDCFVRRSPFFVRCLCNLHSLAPSDQERVYVGKGAGTCAGHCVPRWWRGGSRSARPEVPLLIGEHVVPRAVEGASWRETVRASGLMEAWAAMQASLHRAAPVVAPARHSRGGVRLAPPPAGAPKK